MKVKTSRNGLLLSLILAYSLAVICLGVMSEPLSPDEARTVFMGRETIVRWCAPPGGISAPGIDKMMQGNLGSVAIAPAVLAIADGAARIYGARLLCAALGLLLIGLIYLAGNAPRYGRRGLLAAAIFVFLGVPLQLSACAGPDVFTAVFLCASLVFVGRTTGAGSDRDRRSMLLLGALSLALATMTSYLTALFVLPFVLFVFLRQRVIDATVFFTLPLAVLVTLYGYFVVLPVWPVLEKGLAFLRPLNDTLAAAPFGYVINWLIMPFLLAAVGIFHKEGGKNSFFLMLLAAPAFLINFVSSDVSDVHAAVFLAFVLLAPAAAIGVAQMVDIFSSHNSMALAKPFFTSAVLVIIWVFGIQQIKELKRERPDLTSAVAFLSQQGCRTVLVDSDYGSPEYVYRYYLGEKSPPDRVVAIARGDRQERNKMVVQMHPDYVVVDDHHSVRSFNQACRDYLEQGFTLAATYKMSLVSGVKSIRIFHKGEL
jgi:hypothetical protein